VQDGSVRVCVHGACLQLFGRQQHLVPDCQTCCLCAVVPAPAAVVAFMGLQPQHTCTEQGCCPPHVKHSPEVATCLFTAAVGRGWSGKFSELILKSGGGGVLLASVRMPRYYNYIC